MLGNLFIADYNRVRMVRPDGIITTVAGIGEYVYLLQPIAGTVGLQPVRNLWVGFGRSSRWSGKFVHCRCKHIGYGWWDLMESSPQWRVLGVSTGDNGDGGSATSALLSPILGWRWMVRGNLFMADINNRVRMVDPDGYHNQWLGGEMSCMFPTEPMWRRRPCDRRPSPSHWITVNGRETCSLRILLVVGFGWWAPLESLPQ